MENTWSHSVLFCQSAGLLKGSFSLACLTPSLGRSLWSPQVCGQGGAQVSNREGALLVFPACFYTQLPVHVVGSFPSFASF